MTFSTIDAFRAALSDLSSPDALASAAAKDRQAQLTKPAGSLGKLEQIAVFFAGWQGSERPQIKRADAIVFAGNHGVTTRGVSAFPASVTAQMVANFQAGGAAINALSCSAGLDLKVIALDLDNPTADFTQEPAMTQEECLSAISAGADAVDPKLDLLVLGEMGIGNSTAAAAISTLCFGGTPADWVGPGTGVDGEGIARKVAAVAEAALLHAHAQHDPFEVLRRVGGREIAAIAGAILRARQLRIPVILDGFICCSAIAPLAAAVPGIIDHCLAGHCSAEPGHARLLERLGLEPLLRLDMRLGEGSGAAVAAQIVRAALAAHADMATFAEAGVSSSE